MFWANSFLGIEPGNRVDLIPFETFTLIWGTMLKVVGGKSILVSSNANRSREDLVTR